MKNVISVKEYQAKIEAALKLCYSEYEKLPVQPLAEAMRYSLLAGGKRIRPILVLEFCRITGGNITNAMPVACGVEMLHTYSLIHDDLPTFDNDTLRRGKPTNHVVFGEWQATLAGDSMQAEAFLSILRADLPANYRMDCARTLAEAVATNGMCGGQYLDMVWEGKNLTTEELDQINSRKTGALLAAACVMGVQAAGGSAEQITAAEKYGTALGRAFQIRDDMLDVLSTNEELGKNVGSDAEEQKNTYMVLLGEERCAALIEQLTAEAKAAIAGAFPETGFLLALADSMAVRTN